MHIYDVTVQCDCQLCQPNNCEVIATSYINIDFETPAWSTQVEYDSEPDYLRAL